MKIACTVYNLAFMSNWIEKLKPYMPKCEFIIFHIASLQQKEFPKVDGVRNFDVSFLSYNEIDNIVNQVDPDAWVNFNFRSLIELLLQRISIQHGIRQVYLEHGLFSQNTLHFKTEKAKKNLKNTLRRQFVFLSKYLGFLFHNRHFVRESKILAEILIKKNFSASPFDYYFIYSQREYDLLGKIFPLKDDNTSLVGYPIFNGEKEKKDIQKSSHEDGNVLYVHQPFILDGYASITYDEEKSYLISIQKSMSKKYCNLIVILHPRESLAEYTKRFQETGIKIIQTPNDYTCYINKSLVLGHYSTALFYALYFDRPTAIIDYPTVQIDPIFKDCFESVSNLEELWKSDFKTNSVKKEYMMGTANTYEHIAKEILLKTQRH